MRKKQTSVSYSSTESAVISLNDGLRMDGLPALDLWDTVIEVVRAAIDNLQHKHTSRQETGHFLIPKPRPNISRENRRLTT